MHVLLLLMMREVTPYVVLVNHAELAYPAGSVAPKVAPALGMVMKKGTRRRRKSAPPALSDADVGQALVFLARLGVALRGKGTIEDRAATNALSAAVETLLLLISANAQEEERASWLKHRAKSSTSIETTPPTPPSVRGICKLN